MAKRYKLPDALGGGECDGEVFRTGVAIDSSSPVPLPEPVLLAVVGGVGVVSIPLSAVTEVKPPLPEEPPVGSVVMVYGEAVQHFDDEQYPQSWAGAGSTQRYTWVQLCDLALPGTPTLLVPDPFAADEAHDLARALMASHESDGIRCGATQPRPVPSRRERASMREWDGVGRCPPSTGTAGHSSSCSTSSAVEGT